MQTLKMTADWCCENTPSNVTIYRQIPWSERGHNYWWYLHGELENITCSDRAYPTNCKSAGYTRNTIDWSEINDGEVVSVRHNRLRPTMYINGIVPVEIEGIDRKCVGYFWVEDIQEVRWKNVHYFVWRQRGLVVLADNIDDVAYAAEVYKNKPFAF